MILAITAFVITLSGPVPFVINWTQGNEADVTFAGQRYLVQVQGEKVVRSIQVPLEETDCAE